MWHKREREYKRKKDKIELERITILCKRVGSKCKKKINENALLKISIEIKW